MSTFSISNLSWQEDTCDLGKGSHLATTVLDVNDAEENSVTYIGEYSTKNVQTLRYIYANIPQPTQQ